MYVSEFYNHITLYKSTRFKDKWEEFMSHDYKIEVKGNKARIYSSNPWVRKPSRFNKLVPLGNIGRLRTFGLTVNGNKVCFRINKK